MSIHLVVQQLHEARKETLKELDGITEAIKALNGQKKSPQSTRVLSAAARRRISIAQKRRWRLAKKAA
jgi:hypothetical protein